MNANFEMGNNIARLLPLLRDGRDELPVPNPTQHTGERSP